MADSLNLRVSTPEAVLLDASDVAWVRVHIADGGSLGIRPGHAPLLAETVSAPVEYGDASGEHSLDVRAGILQVRREGVDVLTSGYRSGAETEGIPLEGERRFDRLARALLGRLKANVEGYDEPEETEGGDG